MTLVSQIQTGYASIGTLKRKQDKYKAYAEFNQFLEAEQPYPHTIREASLQGSRALDSLYCARTLEASFSRGGIRWKEGSSDRIIKQTGMLVIGNASHILGVSYDPQAGPSEDEYLDVYGNYHYRALQNAARGILCSALRVHNDKALETIKKIDIELGITPSEKGNQDQIAFYATSVPLLGGPYVGGAAGIMPSNFTIGSLSTQTDHLIDEYSIQPRNPCDRLSGFFGRAATVHAVAQLTGEAGQIQPPTISSLSRGIISLASRGVNIH